MENTIRAAMHPADEFVAMAALIDAGEPIEAVATRFGTTERHVRQRLRLGKLAPELLDAYRNGDISLEVVTAFTLGADHAAQLAVWRQLKDHSYIQPYTVKRLLTESAVPLDSDLGLFVGAAAYEAAGGTVTRDLFSGDDDGFMDDAALVRRLAIEKLEAKAAELRAALGLDQGGARSRIRLHGAIRAPAAAAGRDPGPNSPPRSSASSSASASSRKSSRTIWTDELMTEAAQLEERRGEIDETIDGLAVYSDKDRARAGCIVTIGDDGEFCLHQGLVERAALRAALCRRADADEDDGDEPFAPLSDDEDDDPPSRPQPAPSRRCARNAASASRSSTI